MILLAVACTLSKQAVPPVFLASDADADPLTAGPIEHVAAVSARWTVPLAGLLDLNDPLAADLSNQAWPIVLPVHVLVHPAAGTFVVDTGVDAAMARGERGPMRGLIPLALRKLVVERSLQQILVPHPPLAGVVITHAHLDHVLGLPDVPSGTPIYLGPHELRSRTLNNAAMGSTVRAAMAGHSLQEIDFSAGTRIGGIPAVDLVGDGSLWVLSTPGHTPGSVSVLARTTEGPALFVGDTSHTRFGWEHGVPPGTFTEDGALNRRSLDKLRALAAEIEDLQVYVGHELD